MFDNNYHSGFTNIICDGVGCVSECLRVEGFDNNTPSIDDLLDSMRSAGWVVRKTGESWEHFCPDCCG